MVCWLSIKPTTIRITFNSLCVSLQPWEQAEFLHREACLRICTLSQFCFQGLRFPGIGCFYTYLFYVQGQVISLTPHYQTLTSMISFFIQSNGVSLRLPMLGQKNGLFRAQPLHPHVLFFARYTLFFIVHSCPGLGVFIRRIPPIIAQFLALHVFPVRCRREPLLHIGRLHILSTRCLFLSRRVLDESQKRISFSTQELAGRRLQLFLPIPASSVYSCAQLHCQSYTYKVVFWG